MKKDIPLSFLGRLSAFAYRRKTFTLQAQDI